MTVSWTVRKYGHNWQKQTKLSGHERDISIIKWQIIAVVFRLYIQTAMGSCYRNCLTGSVQQNIEHLGHCKPRQYLLTNDASRCHWSFHPVHLSGNDERLSSSGGY